VIPTSAHKPKRFSHRPSRSRWRRWARLPLRWIDRLTDVALWAEARGLARIRHVSSWFGLILIPVLVAAVAGLDKATGPDVDAAVFYHLPIILSCVLLDAYGLLVIPVCLILFLDIDQGLTVAHPAHLNYKNDLAKLGSFTTVAALTLFARHLYLSLVEKSRELVAKQRLAEREMALAEQVQRSLFNIPAEGYRDAHLTIHAYVRPHLRVGGDFCRLEPSGDDLSLYVGDVVGKGVPAALVMTMCITALGSDHPDDSPAHELQRCNDLLFHSFTGDAPMTATACAGRFSPSASEFVFSLAGHEPPILVSDSAAAPTWETGILLGAVPDPEYAVHRVALRPGDRLVFFTDGTTEARNREGGEFGRGRLERAAQQCAHLPPHEALSYLVSAIEAHVEGVGLRDDLTLVVLERRGGAS
jgi:serine phosphatase RsbU (regulator of sigma subunit)